LGKEGKGKGGEEKENERKERVGLTMFMASCSRLIEGCVMVETSWVRR
jgi:hypothetical protein